jgi:hypothetical protein
MAGYAQISTVAVGRDQSGATGQKRHRGRSGLARLTPPTLLCLVVVASTLAGGARVAEAQPDEITIAFFAPSVYYSDSVARAGFVNGVASAVGEAVGVRARGLNVSRASDLDDADFAIVDGIYFADNETGTPLASAQSGGSNSAPLAILVGASGPSRLSDLRGGSLILPRVGDGLVDFVSHTVLHGEIDADAFFGEVEYASNIESALTSVGSGRADATLTFASYAGRSGLTVLDTYGEAPLPVVVQLNDDLPDEFARRVADAIREAEGSGEISGFGRYDGDAVGSFRRDASRARPSRDPLMVRPRSVSVAPGEISLPERDEDLTLGSPVDFVIVPAMEEP